MTLLSCVSAMSLGALPAKEATTRVLDSLPFANATVLLVARFSWDSFVPYFTAVVLLVLGLGTMIQKSPPRHFRALDKVGLCGPVFIAMPMAVFGTEHYLSPVNIGRLIPAWIPAHAFWVYLVGTCLILGGVSIVVQKYAALSAGLFGVMLICFEVLMHIPTAVANPRSELAWAIVCREFSFAWGGLSYAATLTEEWRTRGTHWLILPARVFIGIALVFFAVRYFLHPELLPGVPLRQLTPAFIPGHAFWGYLNGVVYLAVGGCLLTNKRAGFATLWGGGFVLVTVIVFCVPYMAQQGYDVGIGLNVPLDTLVLSGCLYCLAGAYLGKDDRALSGKTRDTATTSVVLAN